LFDLFFQPEQYFSFTAIQPEQYFSAKIQQAEPYSLMPLQQYMGGKSRSRSDSDQQGVI